MAISDHPRPGDMFLIPSYSSTQGLMEQRHAVPGSVQSVNDTSTICPRLVLFRFRVSQTLNPKCSASDSRFSNIRFNGRGPAPQCDMPLEQCVMTVRDWDCLNLRLQNDRMACPGCQTTCTFTMVRTLLALLIVLFSRAFVFCRCDRPSKPGDILAAEGALATGHGTNVPPACDLL